MQNNTKDNKNPLVPIKNLLGAYKTQIKFIEKYYDEKIGDSKPFRIVFNNENASYHSPLNNTVSISLKQMERLRENEPTLIHAMFYTMLMHEIGHALHTSRSTREYMYNNRWDLFKLQNIVEDNRMEEKVAETNEAVRFEQLQFALIDMGFRKQPVNLDHPDTLALMLYRTFNKKEFAKKLSINASAEAIIKELYELEKKYKTTNNSDANAVAKICSDIYDKLKKLGKIVNDEVKKQYEEQKKQKQQKQQKQEEEQNDDIFKANVEDKEDKEEKQESSDTGDPQENEGEENGDSKSTSQHNKRPNDKNEDESEEDADDSSDDESDEEDENDGSNSDVDDDSDDDADDDTDDADNESDDDTDDDTDDIDDDDEDGDDDEDSDPSDDTDDTDDTEDTTDGKSDSEDTDAGNESDTSDPGDGNGSQEEVELPKDIKEFIENVIEEVMNEMPQEKISELLQTIEEAEKKESEAFETLGVIEHLENTIFPEQPYKRVKIPVFDTVKHKGIKGRDSLSRPVGSAKELSLKRYARRDHVVNEKVFDKPLADNRNKETANVTFYLDFSGSMFSGSRNDKASAVIDYMKSFYDTLNKYVNITLYAFSDSTNRITRNELQYPFLKSELSGGTSPYFQKNKRNEIIVVLTDGQFNRNAPRYILEKAHIIFLKDNVYTQIPSAIQGAKNLIPVLLNDLNAGFNKATASLKRVLEEK